MIKFIFEFPRTKYSAIIVYTRHCKIVLLLATVIPKTFKFSTQNLDFRYTKNLKAQKQSSVFYIRIIKYSGYQHILLRVIFSTVKFVCFKINVFLLDQ